MNNSLYNLKIIKSGNRIELYKVSNYAIKTNGVSNNSTGRCGKDTVSKEQKDKNKTRARKTTLTSTRNNIIRLVKSNPDMNTFITLTFAQELDYKESKKLLNSFFNKLRKQYTNLKYLWVLEFGNVNSRVHYHVLTNIILPKNIYFAKSKEQKPPDHKAFENEFALRYWQHGFIDVRSLDQEGNTNVALYLACYIVKDMLEIELEGYRIYGYSSKTLNKPITNKLYDSRTIEELIQDYTKEYNITYTNSYEVGYSDYRGQHMGITTYVDLNKKE